MIAFSLITGFLGSGKTTLLKNLLHELSTEKRIAVIQNEFAPTGIDGKELQMENHNFKLLEVNNGSVFCVCQLNGFVKSLQKLIGEYRPEIIFLEASGLADPISIVELLQTRELAGKVTLDKIICLVDAANFFRGLSTLVRFKHQLMVADKIIINKTDLAHGALPEILNTIEELNPFAECITTSFAQVAWKQMQIGKSMKGVAAKRFIGKESEGRPEMNACVLRSHHKISEQQLRSFIHELQCNCPRIKGFMNLTDGRIVSIHSVYNQLEITPVKGYSGPAELIAFGSNLSVAVLRHTFKKFALTES